MASISAVGVDSKKLIRLKVLGKSASNFTFHAPLSSRSSSVMLFSRKETSGIPQKSVIMACSSTTVARWSAASPVMLLLLTLCHQGTRQWYEKHKEGMSGDVREVGCCRVFAFLSAGADTKANTRELVRARSSLLERLQRRVALEALGERGSSIGTEVVATETAGVGSRGGW